MRRAGVMLPEKLSTGLEQTQAMLAAPTAGRIDLDTLPPGAIDLLLERAMRASDPAVFAMAASTFLAATKASGNDAARAALIERLLDGALGAEGAVRSRSNPMPLAALNVLLGMDDATVGPFRDAVSDRMRVVEVLRFPAAMSERVAQFRAQVPDAPGRSLADQMRAKQRRDEVYRTLTSGAPAGTVRDTLQAIQSWQIGLPTLHVVLAHAYPLLRRREYGEAEALLALQNIERFGVQLATQRTAWVAEERERRRLPDREDPDDGQNNLYAVFLHETLSAVVASMGDDSAPRLPDLVRLEQAWNDLGDLLASQALDVWPDCPRVQEAILQSLKRVPAIRLRVGAILEKTLLCTPLAPDNVQLAAIAFAASVLSSLREEEAQLLQRTAVVTGNDPRHARLGDDISAILRSNEATRQSLVSVALDRERANRVRMVALYTLLSVGSSPPEQKRLVATAASGDLPMVEAFLRYVFTHQTHSAYAELEALYARHKDFPEPLRRLYLEALTAASNVETPVLLRPDVLDGNGEAEAVLERMGARGALSQIVGERTIKQNVERTEQMDQERVGRLDSSSREMVDSIEHSSQADAASLDATRLGTQGHAIATSFLLAGADVQLELVPVVRRLRELLAQVPEIEAEISSLLGRARQLENQVRSIERQISSCVGEIRDHESAMRDAEATIARLRNEERDLRRRADAARQRASEVEGRIGNLQRELSRVPRDEANAGRVRRVRARIDDARNDAGRAAREAAEIGARLDRMPGAIASQQRLYRTAETAARDLERHVAEIGSELHERRSEESRFRGKAEATRDRLAAIRVEIDMQRSEVARIRESGEQMAQQHRTQLASVQRAQRQALQLFRNESDTASRALSAAQAERGEAMRLTSEIQAVEQSNEDLRKTIEENRDRAASELAELDSRSNRTEAEQAELRRLRQEVDLSIDMLLCTLRCWAGPSPEAARILRRLEG